MGLVVRRTLPLITLSSQTIQTNAIPTLYPHTSDYKEEEFTPLPDLAKGHMDGNECSGLAVAETTPAEGSPSTCACERVVMNGDYSQGPIVKCLDCLDVYRSTDANSCPTGTKLFAPQSRQDWETFLASADPDTVKAPHWIFDVTCPENNCPVAKSSAEQPADLSMRQKWMTSD